MLFFYFAPAGPRDLTVGSGNIKIFSRLSIRMVFLLHCVSKMCCLKPN